MSEPFKSGTTDYSAIRKRMEELGLIKPAEGEKNGVDITPPVEPNAPITPPSTYYGGYYDREPNTPFTIDPAVVLDTARTLLRYCPGCDRSALANEPHGHHSIGLNGFHYELMWSGE